MSIVPYTLDVKYNTHMKPDLEEIKSQQQHVCKIFFTIELFYALEILNENTGTVVICSNAMFLPVFYLVLCDGLGGRRVELVVVLANQLKSQDLLQHLHRTSSLDWSLDNPWKYFAWSFSEVLWRGRGGGRFTWMVLF